MPKSRPAIFLCYWLKASPHAEIYDPCDTRMVIDRLLTLTALGASDWLISQNGQILLQP